MKEVKLSVLYKNNKSGDLYVTEAIGFNANNNCPYGTKMVRYHLFGIIEPEFYRDCQEFLEKFTLDEGGVNA